MPGAPLPIDESRRLAALRACDILDTAPERAFDELVSLAVQLTGAPIALIGLLDESRQWFKAKVGLEVPWIPRDQALCAYVILEHTPLIVDDASRDQRFSDNPLVAGPPGIRFYAGFPLELSDGLRLGTLCAIDTQPRHLTDEQQAVLQTLAHQASAQLELRRAVQELREMRERERLGADRSLEARAAESFRIGEVLHKALAVELWSIAKALRACVPHAPARDTTLRKSLLGASDRVTEAAIDCRALASRIRDYALLSSGWLATVRADIERLQHVHRVQILLEEGVDPDQLLPYAAAQRLSEFVHAALSAAIELWRARNLRVLLAKSGSALQLTIRHDGARKGGMVSALHPASALSVLATELGSVVQESSAGKFTELKLSVALPSPS